MGYRQIDHIYYQNGKFVEKKLFEEEYGREEITRNPLLGLMDDETGVKTRDIADYSLLQ